MHWLIGKESSLNYHSLIILFIRGRKIDEKALKVMDTENRFGVPYSRRDNGDIKKNARAITRKGI